MNTFKYDALKLITLVKQHPCLWNKSLEEYSNRLARKKAWDEVLASLEPSYHTLSDDEQKLFAEPILNKWTNIRDTFKKSLKHQGERTKKYIFHNYLTFLKPELSKDLNEFKKVDSDDTETDVYDEDNVEPKAKRRKKVKEQSQKSIQDNTDASFSGIDEFNDPGVMNEDEAFFASLLPSIVKYTEEQRLEFRIGVLALMKQIKMSTHWTPNS